VESGAFDKSVAADAPWIGALFVDQTTGELPSREFVFMNWRQLTPRIALLAAGTFLMFVLGYTFTARLDGSARPQFQLEPSKVDFGTVRVGESTECSLTLHNPGKIRLLITSIKPSCQCVVSELATRSVEPGNSTVLKIRFTAANAGRKEQRIVFESNDPTKPVFALQVCAVAID
jgi:uncharacterized protein (DUF58 family)